MHHSKQEANPPWWRNSAATCRLWLLAMAVMLVAAHRPSTFEEKASSTAILDSATTDRVREALRQLPLYFIENRGQLDPEVSYYLPGSDTSVYFTASGLTFALSGSTAPERVEPGTAVVNPETPGRTRGWAVKLDFVNPNDDAKLIGEARTSAVFSYFKGEQAEWKTGLPAYSGLAYRDLWPGIDLIYTGTGSRLKYTFVVQPGADPNQIQLAYRGATDVRVSGEGRLQVSTPVGGFEDDAPYAYQEVGDEQATIDSAFVLDEDRARNIYRYGFRVGPYDKSKPLILDPVVFLSYSGYIGGTGDDFGFGIAVDGAGNAYITGQTNTGDGSFPVTAGSLDEIQNGGNDAFVAKVNASGTGLVYCGFIGGSGTDVGRNIAVDGSGNAYATGQTGTSDGSFPVTVGSLDETQNGGTDVFVAMVNATGTALVYSGFIGGSGEDIGRGIAVDSSGNAYVTGETSTSDGSFPVTVGSLDETQNGGTDAFVAKVNATGTALVYSGFLGGTGDDLGRGVAVDDTGNSYLIGETSTSDGSFPVAGGFPDTTYNGGISDAFVTKVDATGAGLIYSGFIGGSGDDIGFGIAVDGTGNAYLTGRTDTADGSFPVAGGFPDTTYNGGSTDAFVTKVSASGTALTYSGFIGGTEGDIGHGIAVDSSGNAYVVGDTVSSEASFPVAVGPDLTFNDTVSADAFVAKVNVFGTELSYCGYIGGSSGDSGTGIAVDSLGDAYVVGWTLSSEASFPVVVGPDLIFNGGLFDSFVAKVVSQPAVSKLIGFETADDSELASIGTGASIDASTLRPGSGLFSLSQGTNASVLATAMSPALDTLGLRFSFHKPSNPGSVRTLIQFQNGASNLWALELRTDGLLQAREDEVLTFSGTIQGSTALSNNTWYTVRLIYDRGAGGLLKVWLDGSLEIDITHSTAGTAIDEVEILGDSALYNYDDFYLRDTPDVPPFGQIVRIGPNGPGNLTEFDSETPAASTHWQNVDETPPDDVNDYNQHTASSPAMDLYALANSPSGTINAVKGMWRMKRGSGSGSGGTHDYAWRVDGTTGSQEFAGLGTAWTLKEVVWFRPPEGTGSWTVAKVDGLELGASHNGTQAQDTFVSWTTAMVDFDDGTTAVDLTSFTATGSNGEVRLQWETASELDNLGFHLYRSTTEQGPYRRITAQIIPGLGSSPVGAKYSYRDTGVLNGVTYFYKLEDIETTGKTTHHGPVSVTPRTEAASTDSPAPDEHERRQSLITYGDPNGNALRVLKRGRRYLVLELITEGFYAEPRADGTVLLDIPDFEPVSEAGAPSIPVKRPWVEAIAGRRVEINSVRARSVETVTGLALAGTSSELVADQRGAVRVRRRSRRPSFRGTGLYPSEPARLLSVGFQADVKKALVELAPLRWDSTRGHLLLARRLVVHLSFQGTEPDEISQDRTRGRRHRERGSHRGRGNVVARLVTSERGLYEVRYQDVFRGRRGLRGSALRPSRHGAPVAFHIEPATAERFGPGSRLYFVSEGGKANPYGHEAVYELELADEPARMDVSSASPSGAAVSYYWQRREYEENRLYQAALVDAPDFWLWDLLMAPVRKIFPFEVRHLEPSPEPARLTVWLQGTSDFVADPDHHVRVYVNGVLVTEVSWNGKRAQSVDAELVSGLLREGENTLELENVGDTGALYSMVMLDRFAVEYPRAPAAEAGRLGGRWSVSGTATLTGLGSASYLLDVTTDEPRWLAGAENAADGALRFRAEAGRSYLAVATEAVHRPEIQSVPWTGLRGNTEAADYLVIGPAEFLDILAPLLSLRRDQGLRIKIITIEEVYSEFGFGEGRPEAIRNLIEYAYHHWQKPSLRYVLLVGDAHYDFKDYLGTGAVNRVPPLMIRTSHIWTVSDPTLAAVNGEDRLPDVAIGRLPAANAEELRVMVEKILAYETGKARLSGPLVLVTDNPDPGGDFVANAEDISRGVLSGTPVHKLHLSQLGAGAMRHRVLEAFDEGASLISYIGHGGIHLWANENIFNIWDVDSLAPQSSQPLFVTMTCLNGYFHFPYFNSLSEELVKAKDKGAIAAVSPSGLSHNSPAHRFHEALLDEVFNQDHRRLGDAFMAAQAAFAESGVFPELLSLYHLLGDPALRLR